MTTVVVKKAHNQSVDKPRPRRWRNDHQPKILTDKNLPRTLDDDSASLLQPARKPDRAAGRCGRRASAPATARAAIDRRAQPGRRAVHQISPRRSDWSRGKSEIPVPAQLSRGNSRDRGSQTQNSRRRRTTADRVRMSQKFRAERRPRLETGARLHPGRLENRCRRGAENLDARGPARAALSRIFDRAAPDDQEMAAGSAYRSRGDGRDGTMAAAFVEFGLRFARTRSTGVDAGFRNPDADAPRRVRLDRC